MQKKACVAVDMGLLDQVGERLRALGDVYWIVGGAGSGKTTVCRLLSDLSGLPVYDMDAHIYGSYHSRFNPQRHPVNWAWSHSPDALAWLLDMSWDEFNHFNQAASPEYLDLLAEDLAARLPHDRVLVDGGISNPGLLSRVIPVQHIVCLALDGSESALVWEREADRRAMKEAIFRLPHPEAAWQRFLEFDTRLTKNILDECRGCGIPVCLREITISQDETAGQVAALLGL
jgi:hypothetical protein